MDITEKDLELIETYAQLKKQQQELEAQIKLISEDVTAIVVKIGKTKGNGYSLSVASKKTWKHGLIIQQMEEEIKELKKQEIEEGKAILSKETFYPTIRFSS